MYHSLIMVIECFEEDIIIKINLNYAIEITKLAKVIVPWAFTNNHRLT